MNSEKSSISWTGLLTLLIILIIVSIVAFVLSSIEGFFAGVVAVFIGLIISFFRDDLKRVVGFKEEERERPTVVVDGDKQLQKLEKKIAKERKNLAKLVVESEAEPSDKKQRKIIQEIIEEATGLMTQIDQAKSVAIRLKDSELVQHYDNLIIEIEAEREKASTRLSGEN
ncbi:MAG: hypothetical protein RTU30_06190 [Candidatus Thorarchaeota archaeon]